MKECRRYPDPPIKRTDVHSHFSDRNSFQSSDTAQKIEGISIDIPGPESKCDFPAPSMVQRLFRYVSRSSLIISLSTTSPFCVLVRLIRSPFFEIPCSSSQIRPSLSQSLNLRHWICFTRSDPKFPIFGMRSSENVHLSARRLVAATLIPRWAFLFVPHLTRVSRRGIPRLSSNSDILAKIPFFSLLSDARPWAFANF
jgi:hypothetical protein